MEIKYRPLQLGAVLKRGDQFCDRKKHNWANIGRDLMGVSLAPGSTYAHKYRRPISENEAEEAIEVLVRMSDVVANRALSRSTVRKDDDDVKNEKLMLERLAEAMTTIRVYHGLSQAALAKSIGLTAGLINNIEGGRSWPSPVSFAAICDVLKVGVPPLMG